jgi:hypothetical protein
MDKEKKFIDAILDGLKPGESQEDYSKRIEILAKNIIKNEEIDSSIDDLKKGIDVSIPVTVSKPTVDDSRIDSDIIAHKKEIEKVKAANRAIISGIATLVVTAGAAAAGGTPSIPALIPVITGLVKLIKNINSDVNDEEGQKAWKDNLSDISKSIKEAFSSNKQKESKESNDSCEDGSCNDKKDCYVGSSNSTTNCNNNDSNSTSCKKCPNS